MVAVTYISLDVLHNMRSLNIENRRARMVLMKGMRNPLTKYSLMNNWPQIYDQGSIGSCTANAFCSAFKYLHTTADNNCNFEPSRLYVYYKERFLESDGDPNNIYDSGAHVIDAYRWVSEHGVCPEEAWPYVIENVNQEPPKSCDDLAQPYRVKGYYQLSLGPDIKDAICWALVQNRPVLLAFGVYRSFVEGVSAANDVCPMPHPLAYEDYEDAEDPFYGGHEVCIVGFDDAEQCFTIANSWGEDWGNKGFFKMSYEFIRHPRLIYDLGVVIHTQCSRKMRSVYKDPFKIILPNL
jgi:C1A family cysteine protease